MRNCFGRGQWRLRSIMASIEGRHSFHWGDSTTGGNFTGFAVCGRGRLFKHGFEQLRGDRGPCATGFANQVSDVARLRCRIFLSLCLLCLCIPSLSLTPRPPPRSALWLQTSFLALASPIQALFKEGISSPDGSDGPSRSMSVVATMSSNLPGTKFDSYTSGTKSVRCDEECRQEFGPIPFRVWL
ncbi:hypothetical protein FB45DRAFT_244207 [Roridomyces roridus]|uniref:Uncharacterized protein n=1 Tax=Roridomyces roridus TaxID=1738132 RepID=A0AAD7BAD0_9AGAR|nr:hypothetical protein FB45DRAFT_244207 [Roridomyces roridus]